MAFPLMRSKFSSLFLWLLAVSLLGVPLHAADIERWGIFELVLPGPADSATINPYVDVPWSATFRQGDHAITVPGFWDGGDRYRVRFSPPTTGQWQYETHSATPALHGQTGSFTATVPTGSNHGPVEVLDTYYLRYADGTPFHQFGTTCYAWTHQPQELQEQTLKTLEASPFNKLRFCIFPKSYTYNTNDPERYAFVKTAEGTFDFSRPDPVFWQPFEQRVLDLQRLGIEADIILWHPYDRWGFAEMSDAEDDRYLRYCVARLGAFRNVWWSLANEFDFMTDQKPGQGGNKQWDDWDRFFQILQAEDPHQRLRSIHNGRKWYDHTKAWVTHASLQTSDMNAGTRFREQYRKPVIYDECRYEGDIPKGWGNLNARTMAQRFWLGTMSGCYVGHSETYEHPEDLLWWSKGGVLRGESPPRIQWLKDFMAQGPPLHELEVLGDDQGRFVLALPGKYYLVYCLHRRPETIQLAGQRPYKMDIIDPWEMKVMPGGTVHPGEFTVTPARPDTVYRFTPYAEGESLQPEISIHALPTEGVPPLAVALQAITNAEQVEWELGDGSLAKGRSIHHIYHQPGTYTVTLKCTDASGFALALAEIVVEPEITEPLIRVGFVSGEKPALELHGTARRGADGSLVLPSTEPWGWGRAGAGPQEDLRGLRSFTAMGWLKPTSLDVGKGGNRILSCLSRDGDGIDLVCLADGRLRLAVNQFPDGIDTDSSPGNLVVGKWTFFAVTYDAGLSSDNLHWYVSSPLDSPDDAEVRLDQMLTYHNGPVGTDVQGLAIGNFEQSMHRYGLDRQFRGEIRAVQLFGSRLSGRGALPLDAIRNHLPESLPLEQKSKKKKR